MGWPKLPRQVHRPAECTDLTRANRIRNGSETIASDPARG